MPRQLFATGVLFFSVLGGTTSAVTFNNVVTLGDSLLDDPGGGRSPVAAEHIAERLGVPVTKLAVSGSTSQNLIASGQHTQAATLFGTGDLAMLWVGGNDFFTNPIEIASGNSDFLIPLETNVGIAMSTLKDAGLEVVAFNLPDMAKVPGVIRAINIATLGIPLLRNNALENIREETVAWNTRLAALASQYDAHVVDVFTLFDDLANNPADFSLLGNIPILNADTGCQFCVFFDDFLLPDVHPSSFAQGYVANEAIKTINTKYDPNAVMPLEELSIFEIAALADLIAGDFNGDQAVTAADLAQWRTSYGLTQADADGDGDSDGTDFLVWQMQLDVLAGVGSFPVPEPQSLAMILMGTFLAMVHRREC